MVHKINPKKINGDWLLGIFADQTLTPAKRAGNFGQENSQQPVDVFILPSGFQSCTAVHLKSLHFE